MNVDMSNPTDLGALIVTLAFMLGICWVAVRIGKAVLGVGGAVKAPIVSGVKTASSMGGGAKMVVLGTILLLLSPFVSESDILVGGAMLILGLLLIFYGGKGK